MAAKKELKAIIKMILVGGQATPAPPIGPTLGQHAIQPGEFCKRFNDMTKKNTGIKLRCEVHLYKDRTYSIVIKTPLTSFLLKQASGVVKGSGSSKVQKVGKLTKQKLEEIAKTKMADLNTDDVEVAKKIISGTARNMGILIE
ncbi:MAG: 50S ribosomal protein L11 [Planctomycetes bacterium]|nr:50S ribosomal protein L11 [Planctomycetota bacterium]